MGSRREEERNEKIIRGLMKLPPNRRCINCNNLGPQYVCTNFWTFVCMTCSGIHREFTHRVKSVSMAKFTSEEVDALQRGGNQRARELYLKAWDPNKQRLPDNSNANKVREFIKNVYVEKRHAAEMSLDRPPRDPQNMQNQDEMRQTSSYHFYSQSPPYDFQYGEQHSGKRVTSLFRKPRSDHIMYKGSFSTFSSPNRMSDCGSDESFENKGIFQRSFSTNDTFKCSMLSPSPQRDIGSPLSETSSFVSRDTPWHPVVQSNSVANNGNNEGMTMHQQEVMSEHVQYLERPHAEASSAPSSMLTTFSGVDLLSEPIAPESVISTETTVCKPQLPTAPAVDSFQQSPISSVPTFSEQQLVTSLTSQTCDVVIHSNGEWMTFDNPQNSMLADASILAIVPSSDRKFNPFSDDHNSSNDSTGHENSASTYTIWDASLQKLALATNNNQFCNAFEETSGQQPIQSMLNNSHQDAEELSYSDANKSLGFPVALNNDGIVKTSDDIEPPAYSYSHYNVGLHDFSMVPAVAGQHSFATGHKPTNPFELPFFADSESSDMASFWDMSLLQSALPNNHMAAYGFDASQSWFPENTVLQSYVPDGGPFGFMVGQVPSVSISSFHAQGPVAYVGGGNPFA